MIPASKLDGKRHFLSVGYPVNLELYPFSHQAFDLSLPELHSPNHQAETNRPRPVPICDLWIALPPNSTL
jgi:hypothetical protein